LQELDGITKRNGFLENKLQNKNRTKGLPDW
jgi:hypothetical protein